MLLATTLSGPLWPDGRSSLPERQRVEGLPPQCIIGQTTLCKIFG